MAEWIIRFTESKDDQVIKKFERDFGVLFVPTGFPDEYEIRGQRAAECAAEIKRVFGT